MQRIVLVQWPAPMSRGLKTSQIHRRRLSQTAWKSAVQPRFSLSKIWVPNGGASPAHGESGHEKLVRAGFLRQSHSGLFQMLPLGVRVQQKIEGLLDKHMGSIGASKVSLSTITSEGLWRQSGRLDQVAPELFRFKDRRETPLMLSPTHEEEITTLVSSSLTSYKDLPLRLYQTTRKYRDEMRPRHGLLRSREFIMKDLYSFDVSQEAAIEAYHEVSAAYKAFFNDLRLPVLMAEASSGDMGGDYSHEYLLANPIGEDTVAVCDNCGYAANDEVAQARPLSLPESEKSEKIVEVSQFELWRGISRDGLTLINVWYPRFDSSNSQNMGLNLHAVKRVVPELDTSIKNPLKFWGKVMKEGFSPNAEPPRLLNVIDSRLSAAFDTLQERLPILPPGFETVAAQQSSISKLSTGGDLNLINLSDGDGCPKCETGVLRIDRALELAHTFYLGTRYSSPLKATISLPDKPSELIPIEMGCYGVGVSRIMGAVAEHMADQKGLVWPRAIAPFEVAIVPTSGVNDDAWELYDKLVSKGTLDVVMDDRQSSFGWKIRDADLTGYPVVIVLGKSWKGRGMCEVQCRSLSLKQDVAVEELPNFVEGIFGQL